MTLAFLTRGLSDADQLASLAGRGLRDVNVATPTSLSAGTEHSEPSVTSPVTSSTDAADQPSLTPAIASIPDDLQVLESKLDVLLQEQWQKHQVQAADRADWLTVCRRISLAMVGSGLSLEEIRKLQLLPEDQRVQRHLESLLNDPRFHDYWAERYARMLVGSDNGPFIAFRRRRFTQWLSDQFAANARYDNMIRQLINASGLWTDRPEVNFYTVTFDSNEKGQPDPVKLAARTTRAFLGLRIDCMQCHDDFLGNVALGDTVGDPDALRDGKQSDFHSLVAFFASARFNGLQGVRDESRPYRFQYLHADDEVEVKPEVPFARSLLRSTVHHDNDCLLGSLILAINRQPAQR